MQNSFLIDRLKQGTPSELKNICDALKIDTTTDPIEISKQFRLAGGHSFLNPLRKDHELPYKKILIDVADKLNPGFFWTELSLENCTEIEAEEYIFLIMKAATRKLLSKKSEEERKKLGQEIETELRRKGMPEAVVNITASGAIAGTIGYLTAQRVAMALFCQTFLSRTAATFLGMSLPRLIGVGTGIGLAVQAPFVAIWLAGPAYRKTIPAVIYTIDIRKRVEEEVFLED